MKTKHLPFQESITLKRSQPVGRIQDITTSTHHLLVPIESHGYCSDSIWTEGKNEVVMLSCMLSAMLFIRNQQ